MTITQRLRRSAAARRHSYAIADRFFRPVGWYTNRAKRGLGGLRPKWLGVIERFVFIEQPGIPVKPPT